MTVALYRVFKCKDHIFYPCAQYQNKNKSLNLLDNVIMLTYYTVDRDNFVSKLNCTICIEKLTINVNQSFCQSKLTNIRTDYFFLKLNIFTERYLNVLLLFILHFICKKRIIKNAVFQFFKN